MYREASPVRTDWRATVEGQGLAYAVAREEDSGEASGHEDGESERGRLYWDESAAYVLNTQEASELERVSEELHEMSLTAARRILTTTACGPAWACPRTPARSCAVRWTPCLMPVLPEDRCTAGWTWPLTAADPRCCWSTTPTPPPRWWKPRWLQWYWLEDLHADCDQSEHLARAAGAGLAANAARPRRRPGSPGRRAERTH